MRIDKIISYENGELSEIESVVLFSELIKSGMCWKLQGSYGRCAKELIDSKIISNNGDILIDLNDIY
jgi:hypothetical protein